MREVEHDHEKEYRYENQPEDKNNAADDKGKEQQEHEKIGALYRQPCELKINRRHYSPYAKFSAMYAFQRSM